MRGQHNTSSKEDAFNALYGDLTDAVCVCDMEMTLLWYNQESALTLYSALLPQMQGTVNQTVLLPADGLILLTAPDGSSYECHTDRLRSEKQDLLICHFVKRQTNDEVDAKQLASLRCMLSASSSEMRQMSAVLLQVMEKIRRCDAMAEDLAASAMQDLNTVSYRMLYQALRNAEMFWYQSVTPQQAAEFPVVNLVGVLDRTIKEIEQLTADFLTVQPHDPFELISARIDPDRFEVALLLLFVKLHNGDSAMTAMYCDTVREENVVLLTMRLTSFGEAHCGRLHAPLKAGDEATLAAVESLLERFCEVFGVTLIYSDKEGEHSAVMRIPLVIDGRLPFASPSVICSEERRFSKAHLVLSAIMEFHPPLY